MCNLSELANSIGAVDNPKALRVSLTKEKLSQLSVAKSQSLYDLPLDQNALNTRPWRNLPTYFTQVLILTMALVKMSAHAKLGGSIEVMGMLTGKIVRNLFIVMDVYSLPVEGTETRVNAQNEAYEFMVQYLDNQKEVKPKDSIVGWYHSHPGYGCWLSGIDVATQSLNQNFQDPYLAIVVDPARTLNQGKVEIGAFRTFPIGYADEQGAKGKESAKESTKDMGAHSDQYYALDVKLFKGPHDDAIVNAILDKSWVNGLVYNQSYTKTYEENVAKKVEALMNRPKPKRQISGAGLANRYERLFERLVSIYGQSQNEGTEVGDNVHGLIHAYEDEAADYAHTRGTDEFDLDFDENGNEDMDNDTESRIGLEVHEDEDDAQSVRTRDPDEPMGVAPDSDDAESIQQQEKMDEMDFFEEYEAGLSVHEEIQRKGTKRNLRTSSEESKAGLPFGTGARENRKRFAASGLGSTGNNELKHRMQSLQLELQHHVKSTNSIGHAELLTIVGKRAQQRVFGKRDW